MLRLYGQDFLVDVDKSKEWTVGGEALRRYGIDYYRRK